MDAKRFDWLLDSLSKADTMLPDPADRAAAQRLGEAFRDPTRWRGSESVRIILVTGPDADPIGWELEAVGLNLGEVRDLIHTIDDHVDSLLDEVRDRRQRLTRERDDLVHKLAQRDETIERLQDEIAGMKAASRV